MNRSDEKRRWKPLRKGRLYCSPACGGGCTWDAYKKATAAAKALAKELGEGWVPHVWERLGWYYEARDATDCLGVSPSSSGFSCYIAFLGEGGTGGRWVAEAKQPKQAVAAVIREAQKELAGIKRLVKLVESKGAR